MSIKKKQITEKQFKIVLAIVIFLLIALPYYGLIKDRYMVRESDRFIENPIISPQNPLSYNTEFCASKLTDLAYELHFLEREISDAKNIIKMDDSLIEDEREVIKIEKRELLVVRDEFDRYKKLCDQFDQKPSKELCDEFIQEAKHRLDLTQEYRQAEKGKGIVNKMKISFNDLRKAQRVYQELQKQCIGMEK